MSNPTENNLTDKYLVTKVLSGNTEAFGTIIKNTEGLVAQIVFKMIPNNEDRKDMAQDIYLKAFHKLPGFKFQSKISTWIGQIAYNTCLSYLEKKKLVLPGHPFDDGENNENPLQSLMDLSARSLTNETEIRISRKELSNILQAEIDRLPPVYKTLLILYHHEDLSYEEIAQITGLPGGTLKSYLFRARKTLKENLLTTYKKEEL